MTDVLYLLDCYTKEFHATVTSANDKDVTLDQTYFYPTGGGQPHDTGAITRGNDTFTVASVRKENGEVIHTVTEPGLQKGDIITGIIDWDRRYTLMRYHTAAHILSHIISTATGALITGNQLDTAKARIDFALDTFDKEKVQEYITQTNNVILEGHKISLSLIPREKAEEKLSGQLTTLAKGFSEEITMVRLVDIDGFGIEACGGTHVKNTAEIKEIKLIKIENKGKNNRRIVFQLKSEPVTISNTQ